MPDSPTCASCRWWASEAHPFGQCRRAAPHPSQPTGSRALWPFTVDEDWCGEHQPSPTKNHGPAPASGAAQPAATEP